MVSDLVLDIFGKFQLFTKFGTLDPLHMAEIFLIEENRNSFYQNIIFATMAFKILKLFEKKLPFLKFWNLQIWKSHILKFWELRNFETLQKIEMFKFRCVAKLKNLENSKFWNVKISTVWNVVSFPKFWNFEIYKFWCLFLFLFFKFEFLKFGNFEFL